MRDCRIGLPRSRRSRSDCRLSVCQALNVCGVVAVSQVLQGLLLRLKDARRVLVAGNGGIALELV
jgi:hypothetical protein